MKVSFLFDESIPIRPEQERSQRGIVIPKNATRKGVLMCFGRWENKSAWWYVSTPLKNHGVRQWEGLHPIYYLGKL